MADEEKDILDEDIDDLPIIELEGVRYELIDTVTFEGHIYIAIVPYSEEEEFTEELEFTILEMVDDPDDADNCLLKTVDDDDLYQRIGDEFLKHIDDVGEEE